MTKDEMEAAFRRGGKLPVARGQIGAFDLFISDGFSFAPHLSYQRSHAIQPGEFPLGMYVTSWWIGKDEKLFVGQDLFIDPSQSSLASRVDAAKQDAEMFVNKLNSAKKRLH